MQWVGSVLGNLGFLFYFCFLFLLLLAWKSTVKCVCTTGYVNMKLYSPITTSAKVIFCLTERVGRQMCSHVRSVVSCLPSNARCSYFHSLESQPRYLSMNVSRRLPSSSASGSQAYQGCCFGISRQRNNSNTLMAKSLVNSTGNRTRCLGISFPRRNQSSRLSSSRFEMVTKIRWKTGNSTWSQEAATTGIILGLLVCFSHSRAVYSEGAREKKNEKNDCDSSLDRASHGKKVYIDYSITGIPGDGRCLFRSVAHGACLRSGKPSPPEILQKELADDLRARVADEFVRRREETEWFVEGDFDTYVSQIRKPHVWGGEPELFMASHVLRMPITVYMYDKSVGGLITIAEYGQEYGKDDPIRVLYHGFGHYDALQFPGMKSGKSKL